MEFIVKILIAIVAVLHCYFSYIEMFAWTSKGPEVFKTIPPDQFENLKVMAGNQGLYNCFLSAGLIWALFIKNIEWQHHIGIFFWACVAIAGVYGAATVSIRIFYVQALPALLAIMLSIIQTWL